MSENRDIADLSFLKTFTDGDHARMVKYIDNFLQFAPAQVESMKLQLGEKNWGEVRSMAHKLKPQLSYMGIKSLKPIIENIESYAEQQIHLEEIPVLISKVESICNSAYDELRSFVKMTA